MSNDGISIKIELQADQVTSAFGNLLGFINSGELMKRIGDEVAIYSQDRITSEENTAPDGTRWPSLAEATLLRKRKKFGHDKILQQRGLLAQTLKADTANATKDYIGVGSSMAYTLIHQFGGKAGRGRKVTIPARPYLGVSAKEKEALERDVIRWVKEQLYGEGK